MDLRDRVPLLPLPLAQLVQRAFHATSPIERHNCAYYLAEACLKLAAVVRIRLYLERVLEPDSRVARRLVCLKLPSVGQWCEMLRATNEELGRLPDAPAFPLARGASSLVARQRSWSHVGRFSDASVQAGLISADLARHAASAGAVGFFELVPAYRNTVMAHGAQRTDVWYDQFGELLLGALTEVLACDSLFDGLLLARPVVPAHETDSPLVWQRLVGVEATNTNEPAVGVDPAQLYFVGGASPISVHPLLIARRDSLGRHQVGFLNRTVVRTRAITDGLLEEVRRVDYLDYATGDAFSGDEVRQDVRELIARTRAESGDEQSDSATIGGVVVGDFELQAELGRGATGVVYRAQQVSIQRRVALKLLHPTLSSDAVQLRRFRREIAALARCDHPNVVKVLTAGADADRNWYAMEFVDGANLSRVFALLSSWRRAGVDLRESHLLSAVKALSGDDGAAASRRRTSDEPDSGEGIPLHIRLAELFADVAGGLQHLHDAGVVHRDIKPGNLMITGDARRIVLMDLGSAHLADASRHSISSDAKVIGTLRYVAPEQLAGQSTGVDARADVYGLGVTLYELSTGRKFFDGDNDTRLIHQILYETALAPMAAAPFLGRDFAAVLQVATEKELVRRYASAGALERDLRAVALGKPILATVPGSAHRALSWMRHHRGALPAAAVLSLVITAAGFEMWNRARVQVTHFASCVDSKDGRIGVGEVDSSEGRTQTCVVYRRAGRVVQAETVNGLGYPSASVGQPASFEFLYSDGGELIERVERRRDGRVRQKHRFAWQGNAALATIVDFDNMRTSLDGSDVAMYRVEYDPAGFPKRQMFFSDRGAPRANAQLAYGYAFEVDPRGLVIRRLVLSASGDTSEDAHGVARDDYSYDSRGNLLEHSTFGGDGLPVGDAFGVATMRYRWDARGNVVETSLFDAVGAPATGEEGWASWRTTYDDNGNPSERVFLDSSGSVAPQANGVSVWRARHDERGRLIEEAYFDARQRPVIDATTGCAAWRARYDDRGNRIEQSFFGDDGKPCRHVDGYAVWRARYDDRSNLLESSYFDDAGKPTLHKDGVAAFRISYDARGNMTEVAWFGVDGARAANRSGYAIRRLRYDERGNVVEVSFFDVQALPTGDVDGIALWRARYDDPGNRIEQTWFDRERRPTLDRRDGVAGVQLKYDDRGRLIERHFLGLTDALSPCAAGYAVEELQYGASGDVARVRRLNVDGLALADFAVDAHSARTAARDVEVLRQRVPDRLRSARGVVVAGLDSSGAAARAGVGVGDVLVMMGETLLQSARDLATFDRVDRAMPVHSFLLRRGKVLEVDIAPGPLGLFALER